MMREIKTRVLFVGQPGNDMEAFKLAFSELFNITIVTNAQDALWNLARFEIPVLVIGEQLEDIEGLELSEQVMAKYPDTIRILLTKKTSVQDMIDALNRTHVFAYINKPWEASEMLDLIEQGITVYQRRTVQKSRLLQLERTNKQLEFMLQESLVS